MSQSKVRNDSGRSQSKSGARDAILVFARVPEVGKCKTRLIPALGPEGATELHTQMVRMTLTWAVKAIESQNCELRVQVHSSQVADSATRADSPDAATCTNAVDDFRREFERELSLSTLTNSTLVNLDPPDRSDHPIRGGVGRRGSTGSADRIQVSMQGGGDLGDKLTAAVEGLQDQGFDRVVIVGTDCPELNESITHQAFARLEDHDLCFSPAMDGGYTLIGLRLDRSAERLNALFTGIDWGSSAVLDQSISAAMESGLDVALLTPTHDVDLPEDLRWWERANHTKTRESTTRNNTPGVALIGAPEGSRGTVTGQRGHELPSQRLSVIIPTYGDEPRLAEVIASTRCGLEEEDYPEILIAASGDSSEVLRTAAREKVALLTHTGNRGYGLDLAMQSVAGNEILFLHADTILPKNYLQLIKDTFEDSSVVAGAFQLGIESDRRAARWIESLVAIRSRWMQQPYGDQGLFVRGTVLEQVGGIPEMSIMEDYELVRRLRRRGRIVTCKGRVSTSARRWNRLGFLRTTIVNQMMILGYHAGISPERLARFYRRRR